MAVEFVGGALLSAFLQVTFEKLASAGIQDYFRATKLNHKLLNKLNITLLSINAVVDDAELKQIRNPNVRAWLDAVKDTVLDAEDLLEEIDIELFRCKLEAESQSSAATTATSKVLNFFNASSSSFDKEIESKMHEVLDNLEFLASKKDILGLKAVNSGFGVGSDSQMLKKIPSTSLPVDSVIYGRDVDKEVICDWLTSDAENDNRQISIVSIVGMGGMGSISFSPSIHELYLTNCGKLQFDYHPTTLKILKIGGHCIEGPLLEWIDHTLSHISLESLVIADCPTMNISLGYCYNFLRNLKIVGGCDSLRTFPLDLFPKLQTLTLRSCSNLEMISHDSKLDCSLTFMTILMCPKFASFPKGGFSAPNLNHIGISKLKNLKALPESMHILFPSLSYLSIGSCPQLNSISDRIFPSSLESLTLDRCSELFIASLKWAFGINTSLGTLFIGELDVESFPDQGLLPLSLTYFSHSKNHNRWYYKLQLLNDACLNSHTIQFFYQVSVYRALIRRLCKIEELARRSFDDHFQNL
ncbi:hypothetical protein P8452_69484 [Trifolium repens]|nr:hypothetical protein P8452_69484 [Trifolium repens]